MTMQTHPRPSQEIAEAMIAATKRSRALHACLLIGHNADSAGIPVLDYMRRKPHITRLELRGTGGDKALSELTQAALARLP
jgi:hypothetical protein